MIRVGARDWQDRTGIHAAETDHRPAGARLIRPDAHIAWAAVEQVYQPGTGIRPPVRRGMRDSNSQGVAPNTLLPVWRSRPVRG